MPLRSYPEYVVVPTSVVISQVGPVWTRLPLSMSRAWMIESSLWLGQMRYSVMSPNRASTKQVALCPGQQQGSRRCQWGQKVTP